MTKVSLELKQDDGTVLNFKKTKIKARWIKEALKVAQALQDSENGKIAEALDKLIDFAIEFFNDPNLTEDVILDSLDADELLPALQKVLTDVLGGLSGGGKPQPRETPSKDTTSSTGSSSNSDGA